MTKTQKAKGPLRTEVILPLGIFAAGIFAYFTFLFDHNLKSALEWAGYEAVGAEVDIQSLATHFKSASLEIHGIDVTNPDKPTHNLIHLGDIRFALLWDGLLRARFIVDEIKVEQIGIDTLRSKPGRVKPPEPKKPDSQLLQKSLEKGEQVAKDTAELAASQDPSSAFSDLVNLSKGTDKASGIEIEKNLASKALLEAFQKDLEAKNKKWSEKFKTLPSNKDIDDLNQKLQKIKSSDFKNPQEVMDSVKKFSEVVNEATAKSKEISAMSQEFNTDLAASQKSLNEVNEMVKKDIQGLESKMHLPHLDAKSLSQALLRKYMGTSLQKMTRYLEWAEKILPKNVVAKLEGKKETPSAKPDPAFKVHPRQHGVSYEFGKPHSYPMFWIRKMSLSSAAREGSADLRGLITDITSNQTLTDKPTILQIQGSLPDPGPANFDFHLEFDNRSDANSIQFRGHSERSHVSNSSLVESKDVKISLAKAEAGTQLQGKILELQKLDVTLQTNLSESTFTTESSNSEIQELLQKAFNGLPVVNVHTHLGGELLNPSLEIESNAGAALQASLERELAAKVAALRKKLDEAIQGQIGAQKAQVESQLKALTGQGNDSLKKVQEQWDHEKNKAQNSADQTQKGASQQAQKQIQQQGQKAVEDLKKAFGF